MATSIGRSVSAAQAGAGSIRALTALLALAALALVGLLWLSPSPAVTSGEPDGAEPTPSAARLGAAGEATGAAEPERREVAGGPGASAPAPSALLVRVVSEGNAAPRRQVGVTVWASDGRPRGASERTAQSDAKGTALWNGLAPGRWQVQLDRPFATDAATIAAVPASTVADRLDHIAIELAPGATHELTLRIAPGFDADVRVVDGNGAPVAGAEVWLWVDPLHSAAPGSGAGRLAGHSDGRGEFTLHGLPDVAATPNWVAARHRQLGASPAVQLPAPAPGERAPLTLLQLGTNGAGLEVQVNAATGPVRDALVHLQPRDPAEPEVVPGGRRMAHMVLTQTTDASGAVAWHPLANSSYRVVVTALGFAPYQALLELRAPERRRIAVELATGAVLTGRVQTQPTTSLRPTITVQCEPRGSAAVTDGEGRFALRELPAGEAVWIARCEGYADATGKLTLRIDTPAQVDVTLAALPQLRGRLTGDDDAPLVGWSMSCAANEADLDDRRTTSDARGEFAFAVRADCSYRLVVREPGHGAPLPLEGLDAVRAGGEPLHVRISPLQRNTGWIEGQLVDGSGNPAIAGQHLALRYAGTWLHPGRSMAAAVVDAATGGFRIGPLPPGPATVVFASSDTVEFAVECVQHPQRTTSLGRLVLPVGGRLHVQLALADGVEPDQITVQLDRDESSDLVRVDRQTLSASKLLRAGRYRARVFGRGFRTLEHTIEIKDGTSTELTGTLRPAVRFGLRVMKPAGERTAKFVVRDGQGQEVLATELDAATSSEDWWPFLDRGVYRAEAIGASGRVYVAEFTVVDLAPRSTPLEVKVAPR